MATRRVRGLSLLGAALLGTIALAPVGLAQAQSKVGVTSATDGDPLGKPPTEAERVLKIGIDVQANEIVTTHANDRAHLVFLDGTSVTVGPNARITIDKFVYDPNSKTGELALTTTQGVFRLVGGRISKTNEIIIKTPTATVGIRGGVVGGDVSQAHTTAYLFYGKLTFASQGQTFELIRAGSRIGTGELATLLPPGAINTFFSKFENGGSSSGGGGNADQKSQTSGFTKNNSGQSQNPPGGNPNPGGLPPNTNNNALINAVNNNNPAVNPNPNTQPVSSTQPPPPGPSTPKTTQTLTGAVGGILIGRSGEGSITAPLSGARPGDLTINTNASTSTVTSTIIIRGQDGRVSSPNATLQLGTPPSGASFFQDNANFITTAANGHVTIRAGGDTFPATHTSALLTAAQVPGGSNVGVGCNACTFLTFGEWNTVITPQGSSQASAVVTRAPWVAGMAATQLPNTQSASFSGGMWGQAQNAGGAIRNVQGTYGMTYNWGSSLGSFNASFDNRNYVGGVVGTGGPNFSGAFVGGNRVGTLGGTFNTGPGAAGAVVGQSGQFAIGGPGYGASGVFAGGKLP